MTHDDFDDLGLEDDTELEDDFEDGEEVALRRERAELPDDIASQIDLDDEVM